LCLSIISLPTTLAVSTANTAENTKHLRENILPEVLSLAQCLFEMAVINNADCNADNGCRWIGKARINERMAHVNRHEIRKRKSYKERLHHTLNHNKGEDRLPVRTNAGGGSGNGLLGAQRCDMPAREIRARSTGAHRTAQRRSAPHTCAGRARAQKLTVGPPVTT